MTRRSLLACALALHATVAVAQQAPAARTLASFQGDSIQELGVSPDGRFVLLATRASLWIYEIASRESRQLADGNTRGLTWSPRGDMITYVRARDGGTAHVWALPVEPRTARARGPAQRVTIAEGESPSFSPDGRFIAFAVYDSSQASHLSIVPAAGGPERILARFPGGFDAIHWSANGGAIFLNLWTPRTNLRSQIKVRVSDGAVEVISARDSWIAGMTEDRRFLVLVPAKGQVTSGDQATIIDTAGREVGNVPLPVGDRVNYDRVLGDSALVWNSIRDSTTLEIRSLSGGSARRLPLIGESNDQPRWSPDGTRIAFQVREGPRSSLAVMDADGTHPRVFRETDVLQNSWSVKWSPDSRVIAFVDPGRHRLSLLDVAAGTHRAIAEDTAQTIGPWQWRADGRAIVFVSLHAPKIYGPYCAENLSCRRDVPGSIDEVAVNGERHQLLGVDARVRTLQFVGGATAFVLVDSAAFLQSLGTQRMRRLTGVPPRSRMVNPAVSSDLRWVAGLLTDRTAEENNQIELFSLETGARTVLDLPFVMDAYGQRPEFIPGGDALLVFGRLRGEPGLRLNRVPLSGDRPSLIADVGVPRHALYLSAASASPDGRSVVYPVQPEAPTRTLLLIDLRGAIPRAPARSPRR